MDTLSDYLYEFMMEEDESWFIIANGNAILLIDLPIYDS